MLKTCHSLLHICVVTVLACWTIPVWFSCVLSSFLDWLDFNRYLGAWLHKQTYLYCSSHLWIRYPPIFTVNLAFLRECFFIKGHYMDPLFLFFFSLPGFLVKSYALIYFSSHLVCAVSFSIIYNNVPLIKLITRDQTLNL